MVKSERKIDEVMKQKSNKDLRARRDERMRKVNEIIG